LAVHNIDDINAGVSIGAVTPHYRKTALAAIKGGGLNIVKFRPDSAHRQAGS
jgi:hypothetical protein